MAAGQHLAHGLAMARSSWSGPTEVSGQHLANLASLATLHDPKQNS
jgi:hypothetical protein